MDIIEQPYEPIEIRTPIDSLSLILHQGHVKEQMNPIIMIPVDSIPDNFDVESFKELWQKSGTITYVPCK